MTFWLFLLAAGALLGSPGPGIATLIAAGRTLGLIRALRVFIGMQLGLALSSGLSAAGLAALLLGAPAARLVFSVVAFAYLAWIAWRTASAPVGDGTIGNGGARRLTFAEGFLLGFANPKAYLAFASLFASFTLLPASRGADAAAKWIACVAVMLTVDFAWLACGALLGRVQLGPRRERLMNIAMGGAILGAALLAAF